MKRNEKKVWVVRSGKHGEREQFALDNDCAVIGWPEVPNLTRLSPEEIREHLARHYKGTVPANHVSQPIRFRDELKKGELVIMPLKSDTTRIAIGEIRGDYEYHKEAKDRVTRHRRPVKWLNKRFRLSSLPDDLRQSLQRCPQTIFTPKRPTADARIRKILRRKVEDGGAQPATTRYGQAPRRNTSGKAKRPVPLVNDISNMDIAMMALYILGGVKRGIHLEEIVVKCHEMAPGRFAFELRKYKQFPDKSAVIYALGDARKEKAGVLVKNSGSRGTGGGKFQLTENGVRWVKRNEDRVNRGLKIPSSVAPKQEVRRILRSVKSEIAFKRFLRDEMAKLSLYDLVDFLGCSFETSPSAVRMKFSEMKAKAELVDDADIFDFLRACEKRFPKFLHVEQ